MKLIAIILFFVIFASSALAEEPTSTTLISRMAMRNAATQHYIQIFQTRGKWILPDVLYVDFGKSSYREVLLGGGRMWSLGKHFKVSHEEYFGMAQGATSKSAKYVIPWTKLDYKFSKFSGNTMYFAYLPVNEAAQFHHSVERAKLEYGIAKWLKVGAGYGGSGPVGKPWQHKPMATATFRCGVLGEVEFWLQRLPGNHGQAWVRLVKTFK